MFNGIIYNQGVLVSKLINKDRCLIQIMSKIKIGKKDIGSSISCNGVCLTLTKYTRNKLSFYVSKETLKRTSFKNIKIGESVNLETSMKFGDGLSGHFIQGHVDTVGIIKDIKIIDKSWIIKIFVNSIYKNNLIEKGSITVNGVSLTISNVRNSFFKISIIPHTLKLTNLINLKKNKFVNIEFDIFSKYLIKLQN
jgi:riboflavin synthase